MREEGVTDGQLGPDPARVAARALAFSAIVYRGYLEHHGDSQEAEGTRLVLFHWCNKTGLTPELEEDELSLIACLVGGLAAQQAINAQWRGEAQLMLAWSLGRAELDAYDELSNSAAVASRLGLTRERADTALENPILRPRSDIDAWANTYLTLHWRFRQHELDLREHNPRRIDLADYVARAKWGPLTVANIGLSTATSALVASELILRPRMRLTERSASSASGTKR